jgi:hypothetical protein
MEQQIDELGNFIILGKPCALGSVYTVRYKPFVSSFYTWQFVNDLERAQTFAKRKTKTDKKIFA